MRNSLIEFLLGARQKIITGWCQNTFAKDINGKPVNTYAAEAVCWCLEGAIRAADRYQTATNELLDIVRGRYLCNWI